MHQIVGIAITSRKVLSQFLDDYTLEQLNKIPVGFSNNMIWNIAHSIVVQQMLVYKLSGLPMILSDEMAEKFKRGTKPEQDVTQEEVIQIQSLLLDPIEKTNEDFENKIFKTYQEFTTLSGVTLKNVEDALIFNCYHEALHLGIIMSIRKFI